MELIRNYVSMANEYIGVHFFFEQQELSVKQETIPHDAMRRAN